MKTLFYALIIGLIIFQNCANPKPPTGGIKDEQAPIIDTTYPTNYSTNVNQKTIIIDFNEKIQINQIEQNLFITPYIDNPFKAKVKKNRLTLIFENEFKENTTYTLNFGNSIKDVTERNESKDIKYIFSTGNYLDSLSIKTKAINPLNQKPCESCLVSIYSKDDTMKVNKDKPLYFTFTDIKGIGKIENIKDGKYKVYVIKDENGNYYYDKNESIGIIKKTVEVNRNISTDNIYMIKKSIKKQKNHSRRCLYG